MDRAKCRLIQDAILEAVKAAGIEAKFGVSIRFTGGTIGTGNAVLKLEAAEVGENGVQTREGEVFKAHARLYGLKPEHLGAVIKVFGREYKIVGFNPRAKAEPFICEHDGKTYKMKLEHILLGLGLPTPAFMLSSMSPENVDRDGEGRRGR